MVLPVIITSWSLWLMLYIFILIHIAWLYNILKSKMLWSMLSVVLCCYLCGGMMWSAWLCLNAWGIYTVKPTWRHGTASAFTLLISIQLWGEGRLHRAESVLQNCVMGRCAICIFIYYYISLFTMKNFGHNLEKFGILAELYNIYKAWITWMNRMAVLRWLCYTVLAKNFTNNINIHKSVFN